LFDEIFLETERKSSRRSCRLFFCRWNYDSSSDFLGSKYDHQKMEEYANAAGQYFNPSGRFFMFLLVFMQFSNQGTQWTLGAAIYTGWCAAGIFIGVALIMFIGCCSESGDEDEYEQEEYRKTV
jgi:hypothetical protein